MTLLHYNQYRQELPSGTRYIGQYELSVYRNLGEYDRFYILDGQADRWRLLQQLPVPAWVRRLMLPLRRQFPLGFMVRMPMDDRYAALSRIPEDAYITYVSDQFNPVPGGNGAGSWSWRLTQEGREAMGL